MSTTATTRKDDAASGERRLRPREPLQSTALVFFGEKNWGKIIDVSESGMRLEFAHAPALGKRMNFALEAMGTVPTPKGQRTGKSFQAFGQIVWTKEFERNAGVRFEGFAEGAQEQFRGWLSREADSRTAASDQDTGEASLALLSPEPLEALALSEKKCDTRVDAPPTHWEPAGTIVGSQQQLDSEFVGETIDAAECEESLETLRSKQDEPEEVSNTNSHRTRTQLFGAAAGLAVIAAIASVSISALRRAHEASAAEKIPSHSARDKEYAGGDYGAGGEGSRPFVVDVSDASNNRWLLWFPDDSTKNASNPIEHGSDIPALSPAPAVRAAREKPAHESARRKPPLKFKLMAPLVIRPATNVSSLDSGAGAPATAGELPPPAGLPSGDVLGTYSAYAPIGPDAPLGGKVQQAVLVSAEPPEYPPFAKLNHIEGDVTLDASVDATGKVIDVKVVSGPAPLWQAAINGVRRWRYKAARLNGQPVASRLSVTIKFHLAESAH